MGDADLADSKTLFSNLRQTLQDVDVEPLKTGRMSSSDELILYCTNSDSPAEVFAEGLYIFDRATRSVGTETPRSGHEAVALSALAICLGQTLTLNQKVCMSLMQILADASREGESGMRYEFCSMIWLNSRSNVAKAFRFCCSKP